MLTTREKAAYMAHLISYGYFDYFDSIKKAGPDAWEWRGEETRTVSASELAGLYDSEKMARQMLADSAKEAGQTKKEFIKKFL